VFDGLLPEPHNSAILDLLFIMAHWHGLAKLRMHHDLTLDIMESVTASLGNSFRLFSNVICPAFTTRELRREANARLRRASKKAIANHCHASDAQTDVSHPPSAGSQPLVQPATAEQCRPAMRNASARVAGRYRKTFNLNTYKLHSYGDYVKTVRQYGTTDSYSTEPVRYGTRMVILLCLIIF
jgi:hypothetical protein